MSTLPILETLIILAMEPYLLYQHHVKHTLGVNIVQRICEIKLCQINKQRRVCHELVTSNRNIV